MELKSLYRDHLAHLERLVEEILADTRAAGAPFEGIVFHAGSQKYFHADDQAIPFRTVPHFARFVPEPGPDHLLVIRPGAKPKLFRVVPEDFWYEPPPPITHPFPEFIEVIEVGSAKAAREAAGPLGGFAYVGNDPAVAEGLGIQREAVEPPVLMSRLDWHRAYKTPYEVACIREAARTAARGHRAVRAVAGERPSERRLHALYLEATGLLENETPFTNIVGWDDHAAILHYQRKDPAPPRGGLVLLVDAGAPFLGYASDVTRTYALPEAHPVFQAALDRLDALCLELGNALRPGLSFVELHREAHWGIARMLSELGIVKVPPEAALERRHTLAFFPHGLGHHLGLQVHDVGGRLAAPDGTVAEPPADFPSLRTTRTVEANQVLTIEPGLYFIPMLLKPLRQHQHAGDFDWELVDALLPHGGIRVEDDFLVTPEGARNLTRDLVPGHREEGSA